MEFLQNIFSFVGRVCISAMFLWGAYEKIRNYSSSVNYLKSKGVPQIGIILPVSLALKIIGGLLVLLGWHAHIGALLLLIVMIASIVKLHAFWEVHGAERDMEKLVFMKEIAIIGGLFMILALGAGHWGFGAGG